MEILKNLREYKAVLCLDGELPCDIIKDLNLPIVAADGAANTLINAGIDPEIIIGDLDSVDSSFLKNRKYLKNSSQDSTDFEKSLDFLKEHNMLPAIIAGINGGYIDHILNNISIFSQTDSLFISNDVIGFIVSDYKMISVPPNTKISILGMPSCIINSSGLKWELINYDLNLCGKNSCCNRVISDAVELKIQNGKAVVFIYTKNISDAGMCDNFA